MWLDSKAVNCPQKWGNFTVKLDQAEVVWCDRTLAVDGDYYYIRVVQKDGNRAWTSPVWIRTHSGP